MISTSGHLISKFPEVRFHRTRIFIFHVSTDYLLGITDKRNVDVTGLDDDSVELISQLIDKLKK